MREKDKEFYIFTLEKCIKNSYECFNTGIIVFYEKLKNEFPNAILALNKMYENLQKPNYYKAKMKTFKKPEYVYEAIANLIPKYHVIRADVVINANEIRFEYLNMKPFGSFFDFQGIDIALAILIFSEEFVFKKLSKTFVYYTKNELHVNGEYVLLKIVKHAEKTYVSIEIKDAITLKYVILN